MTRNLSRLVSRLFCHLTLTPHLPLPTCLSPLASPLVSLLVVSDSDLVTAARCLLTRLCHREFEELERKIRPAFVDRNSHGLDAHVTPIHTEASRPSLYRLDVAIAILGVFFWGGGKTTFVTPPVFLGRGTLLQLASWWFGLVRGWFPLYLLQAPRVTQAKATWFSFVPKPPNHTSRPPVKVTRVVYGKLAAT